MSWISGLADKAEQILTTIDQNAAEKLQKKKHLKSTANDEATLVEVTTVPSPPQQRRKVSPPPSPAKQRPVLRTKAGPGAGNPSCEDDKLMDFLNDDSKPSGEINGIIVENPAENGILIGVEGEKQMLKNEVRVLNNELSLLLHRTKAAEKGSELLKKELEDAENCRIKFQDEVSKLTSQLKAVEHQNIALNSEKKQLEGRSEEEEKDREKLQQLQQQITALQEAHDTLALDLEAAQRECVRLETERQIAQQQADSLTHSLAEQERYRARAQRTLSDKETLISQLRASHTPTDLAVETSLHTELAQLREERQQLAEETREASAQAEALRSRLAEAESLLERVREGAATAQQQLTQRLNHEKHKRQVLEDDCRAQTQELRLLREEVSSVRNELSKRTAELSSARHSASPPPLLPGELEARLTSLTTTLIHKQSALERTTTERNQLRVQLDQLERKQREQQLMLLQQPRLVSANDTDDAKAQVPGFLMESPLDTGVTRRVKRAYSSLDAISVRTGVFLRRYPLARILVVLYVVVLHSLVLMVIYSRTPDNAQK